MSDPKNATRHTDGKESSKVVGNTAGPEDQEDDQAHIPDIVQRTKKRCFIISPIGPHGSETRKRADDVRDYVIKPAVTPLDYAVQRADEIADPGMIMQQIVDAIVEADLLVADLTGLNPNVLYELAIRHELGKPAVTIAHVGTDLPFDIKQVRAILFDNTDLRSVHDCIQAIQDQIKAMQRTDYKADNPILNAKLLKAWTTSGDVTAQREVPIFEALSDIRSTLSSMNDRLRRLESEDMGLSRRVRGNSKLSIRSQWEPPSPGQMDKKIERIEAMLHHLGERPVNESDIASIRQDAQRAFDQFDVDELREIEEYVRNLVDTYAVN